MINENENKLRKKNFNTPRKKLTGILKQSYTVFSLICKSYRSFFIYDSLT